MIFNFNKHHKKRMSKQYTLTDANTRYLDEIRCPQEFTLNVNRMKSKYDRDLLLRALETAVIDNMIDPDYCHVPDRTDDKFTFNFTLVTNTPELKMQLLRTAIPLRQADNYSLLFVFKTTLSNGEFELKGALRHSDDNTILLCSSGSISLYDRNDWGSWHTYDTNLGSAKGKMVAPPAFWTYLYMSL